MIYVLLANGFEEIEAVYPIDVLRRCGEQVTTVGIGGEYITGSNRIMIKPDISIDKIGNDIKMLILPGGPGRTNIIKSKKAMDTIAFCFKYSIPIAAICGAPEILAELGYLQGKKVTCYPGLEDGLIGAQYLDEPVVIDENLITSQAAGTSEAFAFAIAEFICGKEKADEIRGKMKCK